MMSARASDAATLRATLDRLLDRIDLAEREASELLAQLTAEDLAPALAGALLAALRAKGVTADELRGFAVAMRALARLPQLPSVIDAVDIVGTGGDRSGSLNLSTGAALLSAACGVPVIKHGNRSISSLSSDVRRLHGWDCHCRWMKLARAAVWRRLDSPSCSLLTIIRPPKISRRYARHWVCAPCSTFWAR